MLTYRKGNCVVLGQAGEHFASGASTHEPSRPPMPALGAVEFYRACRVTAMLKTRQHWCRLTPADMRRNRISQRSMG